MQALALGEDNLSYEDADNLIFNFLVYLAENDIKMRTSALRISKELGMDDRGVNVRIILKRMCKRKLLRRNAQGWFIYGVRKIIATGEIGGREIKPYKPS